MKTLTLSALVAAAFALNELQSLGVLIRHGARTHLEEWQVPEDVRYLDDKGMLTAAGYAQAIQAGSRFYYKYEPYFRGRRWLKSSHLKTFTSSVPRCVETNAGFMEGWNVISKYDENFFDNASHFGNQNFAPRADVNSDLFKSIEVFDVLRGAHPRLKNLAQQAQQTDFVRKYAQRHPEMMARIFEYTRYEESHYCTQKKAANAEKKSCTPLDMTLGELGDFASTLGSFDYHSMNTTMWAHAPNPMLLADDTRSFISKALRDDLSGWALGRGGDVQFALIMDHFLRQTEAHREANKDSEDVTPLLSLMTTHDSVLTSFMMGMGVPQDRIPRIFYADSIAIEVSLGLNVAANTAEADEGSSSSLVAHPVQRCVRFLYNGVAAISTQRFRACAHRRDLTGAGWLDLEEVESFVSQVAGASVEEDDRANVHLLKKYMDPAPEHSLRM